MFSGLDEESNANQGRVLPPLASKSLYWRMSVICLGIACNRPDILGEFLWTYMPSIRHLLLMSISNRFGMPVSQSLDFFSSNQSSSTAYFVNSFNVQVLIKDSCAEVVSGDINSVLLALDEIEKEIWDSLFVHGFQFRSQLHLDDGSGGFEIDAEHELNDSDGREYTQLFS